MFDWGLCDSAHVAMEDSDVETLIAAHEYQQPTQAMMIVEAGLET